MASFAYNVALPRLLASGLAMKKILRIALPAFLLSTLVAAGLVEVWMRVTWNPLKGSPGLFLADPVRIERLSPNYRGWFAGVRVTTNSLGFRDSREYRLAKRPNTFRILVLGDSVTFGHGSVYEHTYPLLLEQRLKAWKPDTDWQVWNLGVPGYNTSQELAFLLEVGQVFQPDLVIVGFFYNDLAGNGPIVIPSRRAVYISAAKGWMRRHIYSFDWYKKQYLTMQSRLSASSTHRDLLDNLIIQEQLLAEPSAVASLHEQDLTNPAPLTDSEIERGRCVAPPARLPTLEAIGRVNDVDAWKAAVRAFQQLHRSQTYHIAFFVNAAPMVCANADVFDDRSSKSFDEYYLKVLSDGTSAVSSHDAFMRYRPSQMPLAGGHSIGNSNAVKTGVLFEFLRDRVLPQLLVEAGRD